MLWALDSYLMKYNALIVANLWKKKKYDPKYNKYIINAFLTIPETYIELAIEEIEYSEMLSKFNFNWNPDVKTMLNLILKWLSITTKQNNMVYEKRLKMRKIKAFVFHG